MPTYPLATLAATVSPTGISAPAYSDIYASLQASFQSIFGSDVYVAPDSQDGQLLAIVAKAITDCNLTAIAVYNAYSPATAQGVGLSSVVKINGLTRLVPTSSTVLLRVTGVVGTTINSGTVTDTAGNVWALPTTVVIPGAGYIDVTATCVTAGAITAAIGTVTQIRTPTLGWQSVTNSATASVGNPVESDAALRRRQALSTTLPSKTVLAGILGAVAGVSGVLQVMTFENDSNTTDSNGLVAHSIAVVVLGGAALAIATAIYLKKTPGCYTNGTTSQSVVDAFGITNTIRYYIPTAVPIKIGITIKALTGYQTSTGTAILAALMAYINSLGINQTVYIGRLYLPAQLYGGALASTFDVTVLQISITPAAVGNSDVAIAFNAIATSILADMTLTVV